MSRRRVAVKREINSDPKYNSTQVAKFINIVMRSGKKSVAERLVYGAMSEIQKKSNQDPVEVLNTAIEKVSPQVEVKSRRVGGANYQVPVEVRASRATALAMRWLRDAMRSGSNKSSVRGLAEVLLDAVNERGVAIKRREDMHRMAASNKAFSHFRI